jgi:NADH-quinone oxidoreductase subunit F
VTRILLDRPTGAPTETLAEYRATGGYEALPQALRGDPAGLRALVAASGLRGHGGAAFPTARKWELAAAAAPGEPGEPGERYVVANGGEHEPGSDKDKLLVRLRPHAVLEGMLLCGYATGASHGFLYLIDDMHAPIAAAEQAIAELRAAGLLGARILGSGFSFDVAIHRAPTTYVAGEETAAIASIEGQPAKPRKKPPYPGTAGLHGRPTTVNNVETLAHVPWIVRHGAAAYQALGVPDSPGTMLITLPPGMRNPGVHEVRYGTPLRAILDQVGGGTRSGRAVRALLPAMSCGWVAEPRFDTPLAHAPLRAIGSSPGCGGISIVEHGEDPLPRLLEIARFFMAEQCGQCPPCRMETNQLVHVLQGIAAGKGGDARGAITKVTDFARGKGFCSLIEMAAAPIRSALDVFAGDLERAGGG